MGRGCGQVVTVLAFYSNNPSLNLTDAYIFSVKFVFEKNENKQKEAGVGPFSKKVTSLSSMEPSLAALMRNSIF